MDKKQEFLTLVKQSERLAEQTKLVREKLQAAMIELGYDTTIQDPETLAVYKVVKPNGTFMYYRDVDYVRTALEGERAGTLSKKEAESLGFILKK